MTKSGIRGVSVPARQRSATGVFFASWLRAPLKVASIVPSSRRLGMTAARMIDPARPGWVIELGGGTGPVTEQLLARRIPPQRLLVVERDPVLAGFLRERFPAPVLAEGDALELGPLCQRYGVSQVHSIVCGLPVISMPKPVVEQLLRGCLELLEPDGQFIQYTYSLFSPIPYAQYGIKPRHVTRVPFNIPPASVWTYGFRDPEAQRSRRG